MHSHKMIHSSLARFILSNYKDTVRELKHLLSFSFSFLGQCPLSHSAYRSHEISPSLSPRRKMFCLYLFHWLLYRPLVHNDLTLPPCCILSHLSYSDKNRLLSCRTHTLSQSFKPCISEDRNCLPASMEVFENHLHFDNALENYIYRYNFQKMLHCTLLYLSLLFWFSLIFLLPS